MRLPNRAPVVVDTNMGMRSVREIYGTPARPGLKIELDFTSLVDVTQFQVCEETVE